MSHAIRHMHPGLARRLFDGEAPPDWFSGDGCTCAPDKAINGADLREACRWHDWAYREGGSEVSRKNADRNFLRNLKASGCPFFWRHRYYYAVRFWGVLAFNYWTSRPTFREWMALLITRYLDSAE